MSDWTSARNLLCVRLDALGDVLMTTPAIRALKESAPGRRVTLLTSLAGAMAAGLVPEIDEVIAYQAPWMKGASPRSDSLAEYALAERLRRADFDGAVIFTVYSQNPLPAALLCYLAEIPRRLAHCRENPYQLLTHWVPEPEPERLTRHEVRRQLDLVATIDCRTADERLSLRLSERARARTRRLLGDLGLDLVRPWALISPGASAPSRRYPPERFAAAAEQLAWEHGWQVVFSGSDDERDLVARIQAEMTAQTCSLAGSLTLEELAAAIELAPVLIANNSAPAHLAAAVGTPVVDLYALTNPQHTPWQVRSRVLNHDVPCKYCYRSVCPERHHNCLRLVEPAQVVAAARAIARAPTPDS